MSHCLILQRYNDFFIGADSAGSMEIDGSFHRTSNDMKKIFKFGTDIYFCSGVSSNVNRCNKWIWANNDNTINIESLSYFLKNNFCTITNDNCFDIEFFICRIKDGISQIYHLAQYNNFNIVEYEGRKNQINVICGGCKTKEGFQATKNIITCGDVIKTYEDVFKKLSDERIGGNLFVYHNNTLIHNSRIDDYILNTHLVLSDAVISGYIEGSTIKGTEIYGGQLEIGGNGGKFKVNEDGSVEILTSTGENAFATQGDMTVIQDARRFHTVLEYSGSTIFSEPNSSCTITCKVYSWDTDITDLVMSNGAATFSWIRVSKKDDTQWNNDGAHANQTSNTIEITNNDIETNAQFSCEVKFNYEEGEY